jgi:hypothetical protein
MTPPWILASHATWMALIAANCWIRGRFRWSTTYWMAAAAIGSIACTVSHNYDLVLLILIVPYLFWLWDRGHRMDVAFLVAVLALLCVPRAIAYPLVGSLRLGDSAKKLLLSYRALLMFGLAAYILIRGQPSGTTSPSPGITGR